MHVYLKKKGINVNYTIQKFQILIAIENMKNFNYFEYGTFLNIQNKMQFLVNLKVIS